MTFSLPRWKKGRAGTGYEVLTLLNSKLLRADCHLIRYQTGTLIPPHKDPNERGDHYRVNIEVVKAREGGQFQCDNVLYRWRRCVVFRPDLETHSVTRIVRGIRYVLSIGWLRKK